MTPLHIHRSSSLLARSALVAIALAGCAATASSHDRVAAAAPQRTAVLAGPDAAPAAVATATAGAASTVVVVHRVGGTLDAQAQATRLAAEGYDTVIGVGAQARAAVAQADAGEVGDGTRWQLATTR
jgi:hypothetical protein